MAAFFVSKGIPAAAVHSDTTLLSTEPKKAYLQDFRDNSLKILFTVYLFNEGVDFPDVEALLFLRPTESKTIFIQQLGRGLRLSPNKSHVIVLDFIGNFKKAENIRQYITGTTPGSDSGSNSDHPKFGVKDFLDWPTGCDVHFDESVEELFKSRDEELREISDEELKDNYYVVKESLRKKPSPEDMNREEISKYKLSVYRNHFGTWNKFLETIGEATKASYHYPQGTHLGHIFYIIKTLGDGISTDLISPEIYISEGGVSTTLARQTRYKIWACMELGFLYDDRNPDETFDKNTFRNLTPASKTLYNILKTYVSDDDFYEFKTGCKTDVSWSMIHNESYFNNFIRNLPPKECEKLSTIFLNMDTVKHMLVYLFNENKNITHFIKNEVYQNYFSAPYIKSYFEINGIETPTD